MQPTKPKPALVYANPSARDDVSDYLLSHNWYRLDDVQENETDLTRPSEKRPILRRVMLYASMHGAAETTLVEGDAFHPPEVFVTDDLTSLGPDVCSQVAVIGAVLACDLEVHVNFEPIDQRWFHAQVRRLGGFAKISPIMEMMLDVTRWDDETSALWQQLNPDGSPWFLPTSRTRGWLQARERIRVLIEEEEMPYKEVAGQLIVEGYENKHGRFVWYEKSVRDEYKAQQ